MPRITFTRIEGDFESADTAIAIVNAVMGRLPESERAHPPSPTLTAPPTSALNAAALPALAPATAAPASSDPRADTRGPRSARGARAKRTVSPASPAASSEPASQSKPAGARRWNGGLLSKPNEEPAPKPEAVGESQPVTILRALAKRQQSPTELASLLKMALSSVYAAGKQLRDHGLIETRNDDENDGVSRYFITRLGREKLERG